MDFIIVVIHSRWVLQINFEEWKEMGFPGKEIIEKAIGENINE